MIPDIAKNLDQIRNYVIEHKIVGIPPNAKARVKETPQYRPRDLVRLDGHAGAVREKGDRSVLLCHAGRTDWTAAAKGGMAYLI